MLYFITHSCLVQGKPFTTIHEVNATSEQDATDQFRKIVADGEITSIDKVVTYHAFPPIPIRTEDWQAFIDGCEDGLTGSGTTEAAAIADLKQNMEAELL